MKTVFLRFSFSTFIISIIILKQVVAQQCDTIADRKAMVEFYIALDNRSEILNWDTSQTLSNWDLEQRNNFILNEDGCVEEIHLEELGISGTLPDLNLPHLKELSLNANSFLGPIPDFTYLINLETLYLYDNKFNKVPSFSSLANLEYLDCSENQLEGQIPKFNLPKLQSLWLSDNQLRGSIPDFNLPKLRSLKLSNNQLIGRIPNFTGLDSLKNIYLSSNQLSDTIPNFNLPKLRWIDLSNNQLIGRIPDFTHVLDRSDFWVFLSNNKLSGSIPESLNNLKETIDVHSNFLSGPIPDSLFLADYKDIENNLFTFEDLLPANLEGFFYSNQKSIGTDTILQAVEGTPYTLHVPIDSNISTNQYRWYHENTLIATTYENSYTLTSISEENRGIYHCEVTNPSVPFLTLFSASFVLNINTPPVFQINQQFSQNLSSLSLAQAEWGDADGDGLFELLGFSNNAFPTQPGLLFDNIKNLPLQLANRNFNPSLKRLTEDFNFNPLHLEWVDHDKDGDIDIVLTSRDNEVYIYSNEGFNHFYGIQNLRGPFLGGPYTQTGDWNQDGNTDLLSDQSGEVLEQTNEGEYIYKQLVNTGRVDPAFWADTDKDGDIDFAQFARMGKLLLFSQDSGMFLNGAELIPIKNNPNKSDLLYQDFNLDGKLDIGLVQENRWEAWENIGQNIFELRDSSRFINPNSFMAVADVNLDGHNDLIKLIQSKQALVQIYMFEAGKGFVFTQQLSLGEKKLSHPRWVDIDLDGDLDLIISAENAPRDFELVILENKLNYTNTVPDAPRSLRTPEYSTNLVRLEWNDAHDVETPARALSYNVFIGTSRGAVNIVSPHSNILTGERYLLETGNAYFNNFYEIKDLSPGKYYWSVQAIDHHFAGGNFAPVNSFIIPDPEGRELADLSLLLEEIKPVEVALGSRITFENIVYNHGFISSPTCKLAYYISSDTELDSLDILLGSSIIPEIATDQVFTLEDTFIFPTTLADSFQTGEYFIIFSLDDDQEIEEYNESDNRGRQLLFFNGTKPQISPPENSNENPIPNFPFNESNRQISHTYTFNNPSRVGKVELKIEGISGEFQEIRNMTDEVKPGEKVGEGEIIMSLSIDDFKQDSLGLRYQLSLIDTIFNENLDTSAWFYTYRSYINQGMSLPRLQDVKSLSHGKFTSRDMAYNMIAFPLYYDQPALVRDVFYDDLGEYKARDWRLFKVNPTGRADGRLDFIEFGEAGFDKVTLGEGYFLIMNQHPEKSISTGPGNFPQVTIEKPFESSLEQGWNLIGNPYNFNLSWEVVMSHNDSVELNTAYVFRNGQFKAIQESDVNYLWNRFEGLLVWHNKPIAKKIQIPVKMDPCLQSNNSCRSGPKEHSPLNAEAWSVNLTLNMANENIQGLIVGMHPDASPAFDTFDYLAPPIIGKDYLQFYVPHPEHKWGKFAGDIVPNQTKYVWNFQLSSSFKKEKVKLNWDNQSFGENDYTLILFDQGLQKIIDLRNQQSYVFDISISKEFQIHYLQKDEVSTLLPNRSVLGFPYPNPFQDFMSIPYTVPEKVQIQNLNIEILSVNGQLVRNYIHQNPQAGFYHWDWDGKDTQQQLLPPGIYFCRLIVDGKMVGIRKVLVRK